jgi:hypothetical protein
LSTLQALKFLLPGWTPEGWTPVFKESEDYGFGSGDILRGFDHEANELGEEGLIELDVSDYGKELGEMLAACVNAAPMLVELAEALLEVNELDPQALAHHKRLRAALERLTIPK